MNSSPTGALISTDALAARLADPDIVILDGTYHLATANRDADAEFARAHLPGAVRFDIDDICDPESPLPHMLPSPRLFAEKVSALGIGNGHHVVVYDVYGMQSAARVWWMFRVFGHDRVSVLDGGLPKWRAEERAITQASTAREPARFTAAFVPALVRGIDDVRATLETGTEQVVDARSAGRVHRRGTGTPTRNALRPHAWRIQPPLHGPAGTAAQDLFGARNRSAPESRMPESTPARPVVTSCGSGVTACAVALGFFLAGKSDVGRVRWILERMGRARGHARRDRPVIGPSCGNSRRSPRSRTFPAASRRRPSALRRIGRPVRLRRSRTHRSDRRRRRRDICRRGCRA